MDGLDEVTVADKTMVVEAGNDGLRTFEIAPEDFGLTRSRLVALRGDNPEESASTIRQILEGSRRDQARDLVVINAAAALVVGGMTDDLTAACHLAEISIDSGAALEKLEALTKVTNE
jgi:anthranilate phosphoribosyltransferase